MILTVTLNPAVDKTYRTEERFCGREMCIRDSVYTKEKCKDCFAKFYCSGGCAANAWNFSGDINGCYEIGCELQRKRVECAIMMKAALAEEN